MRPGAWSRRPGEQVQWDTLRTTRTKPRRQLSIASIGYRHFNPVTIQAGVRDSDTVLILC